MIILKHAKFISGTRIYRAGEILPDTQGVRELVAKGIAVVVNPERTPKTAKRKEQDKTPETVQEVSQEAVLEDKNDKGNS